MGEKVIELYSPAFLEKQKKQNRLRRKLIVTFALLGLAACVILCIGVNTENCIRRMIAVFCISVLTGWILIYRYLFCYRTVKREIAHGENLNTDDRRVLCGVVTVEKQAYRIRNSINFRKVLVDTAEGREVVNINASRSRELQKAGNPLKLYIAHSYVAAFEVYDETV